VVEISRALISERHDRQRARVGLGITDGEDVVDLIRADEGIDFGYLGFQLVPVTLNQTTRDNQSFRVTVSLELSSLEDRVDRLFLSRVDKPTRVNYDRVSVFSIRCDLISVML